MIVRFDIRLRPCGQLPGVRARFASSLSSCSPSSGSTVFGDLYGKLYATRSTLIRPDRKGEKPRFGKLGGMRQWIESIYQTTKSQLSLEDHGGHIPDGVWARVCQRALALAAGVWHSWLLYEAGQIDAPGRHFTAYDH